MKKVTLIAILVVVVSLFSNGIILPQTWVQRSPIPTERWNPASVVLDGKIYVIGGQGSTDPYVALSTVEVYDPVTDTWEVKSPMPTPRWGLVAEVVNNKIYAIGGRGGSFSGGHFASDAVEEYDPITDSWTSKTSMPTPRGWAGGAVINDTIFVFGGRGVLANESVVEKYYPATDSWTTESSMPEPRATFMTAVVNNKVYLIGGWYSNLVQEYDPATKIWTTKAPMPTERGGSGIGVVHNRIYVVGGRGGNSNEFESYEPIHDRWTSWTPMPTRREGLTAAVVNNKLYAITGSVPIAEGGLPYYHINEEASNLMRPNIRIAGFTIDDSLGNNNGMLNTGESANLIITLEEVGYAATNLTGELHITDENITVQRATAFFGDTQPFQEISNANNPFTLTTKADFEAHWTTANLIVSANGGYIDTLSFNFSVGNPSILLIDDDAGMKYEEYYHTYLYSLEKVYCHWDMKSKGYPSFDLTDYETIIWFTGDDRDSTLTPQEQTLLINYLQDGGHLIISGQNIGYDLVENGSEDDSLFFANYLHAEYIADSSTSYYMRGVTDDPIGNGKFIYLFGPHGAHNQNSPSIITPLSPAVASITYLPPTIGASAIRYADINYKIAYFAFGLEGIGGPYDSTSSELLANTLAWLSGATSVEEQDNYSKSTNILTSYRLFQNFPNPFNSKTTIKYALPEDSWVTIKVFNILGKEIKTLVNQHQRTGYHQIQWDGTNEQAKPVTSGIYLIRMEATNFMKNRKLLLLR